MSGADFRNVHVDDLRVMFDLVANSLDMGSGFLDTDEMRTLERIGQMVGAAHVRCRNVDHDESHDYYGQCVLPIGHDGGHEYMGAGCALPYAPRWDDYPRQREWMTRHYGVLNVAVISGVRPYTREMI